MTQSADDHGAEHSDERFIKAIRKDADVYDVFYSDDAGCDFGASWSHIETVAKKFGYREVHVDQSRYCPEGEPKQVTIEL